MPISTSTADKFIDALEDGFSEVTSADPDKAALCKILCELIGMVCERTGFEQQCADACDLNTEHGCGCTGCPDD